MLKSFFEYNCELRFGNGSKRHLFAKLKIEQAGEVYMQHFGRYPVIFLSFKDIKASTWEAAYAALKKCIYYEYGRHINVADSEKITEAERSRFRRFVDTEARTEDFPDSIRFLTECLKKHYNRSVVILIDEYDVPLKSNRETGCGRSDILLRPRTYRAPVIIIEAKIASSYDDLTDKSKEALKQIDDNRYADEFIAEGYPRVLKYGVAFYRKECVVAV